MLPQIRRLRHHLTHEKETVNIGCILDDRNNNKIPTFVLICGDLVFSA